MLADLASAVAEKKGRLFIHCEAGVNRSGALCLAYHLATSGMGLLGSAKHCNLESFQGPGCGIVDVGDVKSLTGFPTTGSMDLT